MRGLPFIFAGALLVFAYACGSSPDPNDDDDDGSGGQGAAATGGGGALPDPKPLKVVNWNVKNLIDNQDDGEMFETQDPGWRQHITDVARVLNAIDADVVVLQEVEHTAIVGELVAELDPGYLFHQVIDANDPRGIDVGLISKIEPDDVITHQQDTFTRVGTTAPSYRFARDALEMRFTFNGRRIAMFGVHYKSKDNDDPNKRLAEAQRARALADSVTESDPELGVLILGDFNDLPGSEPLDWSIGTEPDVYHAVTDHVSEADRWTFNFQNTLELVDHQLANQLMADRLNTGSVRILHGPEVDAASDHAPIMATYDVN